MKRFIFTVIALAFVFTLGFSANLSYAADDVGAIAPRVVEQEF